MYMAEKAQTLVLLRLCTLPVLPYKVEALADWMLDSLKELNGLAGESLNLEDIKDKSEIFKAKASDLDEKTSILAKKCEENPQERFIEVDTVNTVLMKISRTLNPVNYTLRGRYDQDYYGAEYIKPIPSLSPVTELAKLNPDATEYKTLQTKLVRARNQVSDTIDDALWLTDYIVNNVNT